MPQNETSNQLSNHLAPVTVTFLSPFKPLLDSNYRYLVYFGGRAAGKSWHVALALLIRARKSQMRVLCAREIQNTISASVHQLLKDLITMCSMKDYIVTNDSITNLKTGSLFIFKGIKHNTAEIKSMEGIDVCWIEEGQSVTDESLDIIIPTIRKPGSQIIITFNRFLELDPVYLRFVVNQPPDTYAREVTYDIMAQRGLLSDRIKAEIEYDKTNDPDAYAYKWLGQPVSQADTAILSRAEVLGAMQRTVSSEGAIELGVDVARFGDDRTTIYKRKGLKIVSYKIYTKLSITEVYEKVLALITDESNPKNVLIKVDDTGVGGGLTDLLRTNGYRVMPINFGGEPSSETMKDKYPNIISEAWFYLKSIINLIDLPFDNELLMELTSRQWKPDMKGRRAIESKADYKKRGNRSPDKADGLIVCFFSGTIGTYGKQIPKPPTNDEVATDPRPTRQSDTSFESFGNLHNKVF